jgi:GDP-mannose 6-dehydrogenase
MKINVFGLGYVGCVTAACLAKEGHKISGIDVDSNKVHMINNCKSPIIEQDVQKLLEEVVASGRLRASNKVVDDAEVSFVCVGTPSGANGNLKYDYLLRLSKEIGPYLRYLGKYHVVNIRSTVIPETVEKRIVPMIEKTSGKKAGRDFGVCMNPEFLREGTSLKDFYSPPFTVIGQLDKRSGDAIENLYKPHRAPVIRTSIRVAEMVKYACNSFHALKVVFANEIGNICKKMNIDSHEVFDVFCLDKKLNLSSYYLKPGFAFGGSCLPKDLSALIYKSKTIDLEVPVLKAILESNKLQVEHALNTIMKFKKKKVGILGLSFKQGTDDLRESPIVELVERLIGKGYEVSIFDREVILAKLFGANKKYIEKTIPHISSLFKKTPSEVVENSDVVVFAKKDRAFEDIAWQIKERKKIVDLIRTERNDWRNNGSYEGICW